MIIVIADTSGLLAALDATHPLGLAARQVIDRAGTLVVSPVLLGELDHVGRRVLGPSATSRTVDVISRWARTGRAVLPTITGELLQVAQTVRSQHAGLDLDLADAVNVALAWEFHTDALLTLDERDFRAIRPLSGHPHFRLLPLDT